MKSQIYKITWFIPLELNHSSYIYTSLIEYCKAENIILKISYKNLNRRGRISVEGDALKYSNHFNPKVNWIQIQYMTGLSEKIAFDLNDIPNHFSIYALKKADIYYKRCYQENFVKTLPEEYNIKIRIMGIPFMVRPNELYSINKIRLVFYTFKFLEYFKFDRLIVKRIKFFKIKALQNFSGFINTRRLSDFNSFNAKVSGNIFYQKRLFDEKSDDVRKVNKQRVETIRLLKTNFPNNFYGGLQKNKFSESKYSDLISNIDGNHQVFLNAMRECGICIYTKGLMESPGWTLPEFLSQGKCIVAEPLANKIPDELINGTHLVYFANENELIDICRDLLADAEKRTFLGKNARQYYENYVAPSVFFQNLLNANFE